MSRARVVAPPPRLTRLPAREGSGGDREAKTADQSHGWQGRIAVPRLLLPFELHQQCGHFTPTPFQVEPMPRLAARSNTAAVFRGECATASPLLPRARHAALTSPGGDPTGL